jgi:hypothetical protein
VRLLRSTALSTVERMPTTSTPPEPRDEQILAARHRHPRRSRFAGWLAPSSPALVYLGIALVVAGFGTIAFTWSRVAGTAIVVLQLPYLISGGFTGLALVVVGVLSMYLGAKRRDAWRRDRRLEELGAILAASASRGRLESTRGDDEEPEEA